MQRTLFQIINAILWKQEEMWIWWNTNSDKKNYHASIIALIKEAKKHKKEKIDWLYWYENDFWQRREFFHSPLLLHCFEVLTGVKLPTEV